MDLINANLANIWLLIIGFFLLYYTLTDGADLGIGMLTLFTRDQEEKNAMMQSIHTIWHGNQTWLVILGGMLFGAFPLFYSIVLSALYIPFILMLFGFIFRGVAFEFHAHAKDWGKPLWLLSFGLGSLMATLGQGFALGGLMGGIAVQADSFAGKPTDWMNWYSAIATLGVICGYLMLGSGFLIARTTGRLQQWSYSAARLAGGLTIIVSAAVYIGTSIRHEEMAVKLTSWPPSPIYFFAILTIIACVRYFRSLNEKKRLAPLVWNWLIIIFSFTGLSIGLYPEMIPSMDSTPLTVQDVAASETTLRFMLVVMAVLLPIILTYTSYNYWIFRNKKDSEGYAGS